MDNLKSHGNNSENKMTIQDVRNVLYSKEFWEAQRSYIGAKRNLDNALREVRYNIDRANTIDCDVKSKYGNEDQTANRDGCETEYCFHNGISLNFFIADFKAQRQYLPNPR